MITINMSKAVQIRKDQLRAERAPLFLQLTALQEQAAGDADRLAEIEGMRQQLRDITQLCDEATTLGELKSIMLPDIQ